MQVREVSPRELDYVTAVCLDPSIAPKWREAMKSAMDSRRTWLKNMMRGGLKVSVALEEPEVVVGSLGIKNAKFKEMVTHGKFPKGLIEYLPVKAAPEPVKGGESLFIDCLWVVPPFWHSGVAKALLERAVDNARACGGLSVLAYEGDRWFGFFPYMPASFFKRFGFNEVDRDGSRVLLHLDLGAHDRPTLIRPRCRQGEKSDEMVVDIFFNSQCPWSRWTVDRISRNMRKYRAVITLINTDDRKIVEKYGMSRGVCVNGQPVVKRMASWKEIESSVKRISTQN